MPLELRHPHGSRLFLDCRGWFSNFMPEPHWVWWLGRRLRGTSLRRLLINGWFQIWMAKYVHLATVDSNFLPLGICEENNTHHFKNCQGRDRKWSSRYLFIIQWWWEWEYSRHPEPWLAQVVALLLYRHGIVRFNITRLYWLSLRYFCHYNGQ